MDKKKKQSDKVRPNYFCDYVCESCQKEEECVLYSFQKLGKKFEETGKYNTDDYFYVLAEMQASLDRIIEQIRTGVGGLPMDIESGHVETVRVNDNLESFPVMFLSREFTNKIYEFLKGIITQARIPSDIMECLQELQHHYALVSINTCRAMAGLINKTEETNTIKMIIKEAEKSLNACNSALTKIGKALPEEQNSVSALLALSERIKIEMHLQFL